MTFSIAGVRFDVQSEDIGFESYLHAFMDGYDRLVEDAIHHVLSVSLRRVDRLPSEPGTRIGVHRSKHAYWNLEGRLLSESPRRVVWDSRGLAVTIFEGASRLDCEVERGTDPVFAGEALFHAFRGLALYLRRSDHMLHASAIVWRDRVVAFVGDVLGGKSTILAELTLRTPAMPFTNDRLMLERGPDLVARSWPSYSSFCEGTLLSYPELAAGAARYEADDCPYRTCRWSRPLRHTFEKDHKRFYPMSWFREATGKPFARRANLGAILFVSVDPLAPRFAASRLGGATRRDALAARLRATRFDSQETSFLPWHGLSFPARGGSIDALVDHLVARDLPLYDVVVPPTALDRMRGFIAESLS